MLQEDVSINSAVSANQTSCDDITFLEATTDIRNIITRTSGLSVRRYYRGCIGKVEE